jgi:hypothetical protein
MGACKDSFKALYSARVGGLNTGLDKPWIDPKTGLQKKEGEKLLTLQDYMERKWNLTPNYLTNRPWRPEMGYSNLTYFDTKSWLLNDGTTVLDLANMDDEIFYYVCLASSLIANSEREWRAHKWPKAQWYIALENESDEIKYQRSESKSKCFHALHSEELTEHYKSIFLSLLNLSNTKTSLTQAATHNLLFEYIDKSTFGADSNINKFRALCELLTSPKGKSELEARHFLQKLLDHRVVIEKSGTYTFLRPPDNLVIAERYEDAIEFILNPKKDKEIEAMQQALKSKQ